MRRVGAFGRFWWEFIVGDDWRVSVQIVVAIAATAAVAAVGVSAWWLLPLAVARGALRVAATRDARLTPPAPGARERSSCVA